MYCEMTEVRVNFKEGGNTLLLVDPEPSETFDRRIKARIKEMCAYNDCLDFKMIKGFEIIGKLEAEI